MKVNAANGVPGAARAGVGSSDCSKVKTYKTNGILLARPWTLYFGYLIQILFTRKACVRGASGVASVDFLVTHMENARNPSEKLLRCRTQGIERVIKAVA